MMTEDPFYRPTAARRRPLAFLLLGCAALVGCHRYVAVSHAPPLAIASMEGAHGFAPAFLAVCTAMGWTATCDDPVYTDDQKLKGDANNYGPHAYITPTPGLNSYTANAAFTDVKLVGLVFVQPEQIPAGGLPMSYTNLGLTGGSSCLYLHFVADSFRAYVEPNTSVCATAYTPNPARRFRVRVVENPGEWGVGTDAEQADRIAPVARFHEGRTPGAEGMPLLGIRCGSKWCMVLPRMTAPEELPPVHRGEHPHLKTWSVHGWFDAQHLADNNAGIVTRSDQEASIIADGELSTNVWAPAITPGWKPTREQHAATIRFRDMPRGIYDAKWHFRKGRNELYVWKDATGTWQGEIQNKRFGTTYHIAVFVQQRHAGMNPPYSARFRWDPNDEEIWVACDGGCCYVSAYP